MNIEESDWADSISRAAPLLGHVHFADSNRRAMGMGHTDYKRLVAHLHSLGYKGYLSAEIFPLPNPQEAGRQTLAAFREATRGLPE
jgi:sugar phosphate isomerase/epimerase